MSATTVKATQVRDELTDVDFAVANKDGVAGTPCLRTLGTGALQALAGNTAVLSLANPTASIGLTAINGVSTLTAMRSDAAPALDVSITPTWTGNHIWSKVSPIIELKDTAGTIQRYQWRNGAIAPGSCDLYNVTGARTMMRFVSGPTWEEFRIGTATNVVGNNSRVFIYGGGAGCNLDLMGEAVAGRDQALVELEGSDYVTQFTSTRLAYYGVNSVGTTMGFSLVNQGHLAFCASATALIYTDNATPIVFGINLIETIRLTTVGIQASMGGANATAFAVNARKSRGTVLAPTVITTGDDLLTISGLGYVGATNTYVEAARLLIESVGAISDSATGIGGKFVFSTRAPGVAMVDRLTIDQNGLSTFVGNALITTGSAYGGFGKLEIYTTDTAQALYAINVRTTGSNYGFDAEAIGSGADMNVAGFFYATGATLNRGVWISGPAAGAGNYAIYCDAAAKSYIAGAIAIDGLATFATAPVFSNITPNNILFAGTAGLVTQDANLYWSGYLYVNSVAVSTALYLVSTDATAYTPTSYTGGPARINMTGGNAAGAFIGTRFTAGGSNETAFGVVQNAGGFGEFVWQGYNAGAYSEWGRLTSTGFGLGTTTPTNTLSFGGNVVRKIWMERHTTANTTGNSLTVQAGGATSGATNKVGGSLILAPGIGVGDIYPAQVIVQGTAQGAASSTTDQTLVNRVIINGGLGLSTGVARSVLSCTVGSGQQAGGHIVYSVEASNGTDLIVASGQVAFSVVNKAGTFTSATSVIGAEAQAKSDVTDTIVNTWAFEAATGNLQVTSTITGMSPTMFRITFLVISNAQQEAITSA